MPDFFYAQKCVLEVKSSIVNKLTLKKTGDNQPHAAPAF